MGRKRRSRKRRNGEQPPNPTKFVVPNEEARGAVIGLTGVTCAAVCMFWMLPLLVKKGPDLVPGATVVLNIVLTVMIVICAIGWILYPRMVKTVTPQKRERREQPRELTEVEKQQRRDDEEESERDRRVAEEAEAQRWRNEEFASYARDEAQRYREEELRQRSEEAAREFENQQRQAEEYRRNIKDH